MPRTFPKPSMVSTLQKCKSLFLAFALVAGNRDDLRLQAAKTLVRSWYSHINIPGEYIAKDIRETMTRVEGDLTQIPTIWAEGIGKDGGLGTGRWLHHTRPNPAFNEDSTSVAIAPNTINYLLWKGLSRSRDSALDALEACKDLDDLEPLLSAIKRVVVAFQDFHAQVTDTFSGGPEQLNATNDEYGPETTFWVKARGYIACQHQPRKGPEKGGSKHWCNPESLLGTREDSLTHPRQRRRSFVLSAGSANDFAYEEFVSASWPAGTETTVVTLDCTSIEEESSRQAAVRVNGSPAASSIVTLPICLTGEDDRYLIGVHERLQPKFKTWAGMLHAMRARFGASFDHFDVVKVNIEGFEYPVFAHAFERPDENLRGVSHVHLEVHRMGMQEFGLAWPSLVFLNLLLAHFFSGGFLPFAHEKWHDSTAASDLAFVNQSYFLESEVEAARAVRKELHDALLLLEQQNGPREEREKPLSLPPPPPPSPTATTATAMKTSAAEAREHLVLGLRGEASGAEAHPHTETKPADPPTNPDGGGGRDDNEFGLSSDRDDDEEEGVVSFPPGTLSEEECAAFVAAAEAAEFPEIDDPVDFVKKHTLTVYLCPDETGVHAPCPGFNPHLAHAPTTTASNGDNNNTTNNNATTSNNGGDNNNGAAGTASVLDLARKAMAAFEAEVLRAFGEPVRVYWAYVNRYSPSDAKPGLRLHTDSCDFTGNLLLLHDWSDADSNHSNSASASPNENTAVAEGQDDSARAGGLALSEGSSRNRSGAKGADPSESASGTGGGARGGDFFVLDAATSAKVAPLLDLAQGETMEARNGRVDALARDLEARGGLQRATRRLEPGSGVAHPGTLVHGVSDVRQGRRYSLIFFANRLGVVTVNHDAQLGGGAAER